MTHGKLKVLRKKHTASKVPHSRLVCRPPSSIFLLLYFFSLRADFDRLTDIASVKLWSGFSHKVLNRFLCEYLSYLGIDWEKIGIAKCLAFNKHFVSMKLCDTILNLLQDSWTKGKHYRVNTKSNKTCLALIQTPLQWWSNCLPHISTEQQWPSFVLSTCVLI